MRGFVGRGQGLGLDGCGVGQGEGERWEEVGVDFVEEVGGGMGWVVLGGGEEFLVGAEHAVE